MRHVNTTVHRFIHENMQVSAQNTAWILCVVCSDGFDNALNYAKNYNTDTFCLLDASLSERGRKVRLFKGGMT